MRTPKLAPHVWIYSAGGRVKFFHLTSGKNWRPNKRGVQTLCGNWVGLIELSIQPPTHLEMCDKCVLADSREPTVYRFWDADDVLLYVGCSEDVLTRFEQHSRSGSPSRFWWPRQVRHSLTTYPTRVEALAAERKAIASEKPLFPRPKYLVESRALPVVKQVAA